MSEIPTFSQYDGKRAKVRCSIQWVIMQAHKCVNTSSNQDIPRCDVEHLFECDGGLKKTIATLLCSGEPYCTITQDIFDVGERLCSHEDVIQILCRRGLYVLDDADTLITANDLRKMPLDLSSHISIIDMLMFAFVTHKLTSINMIVSTVRKFSEFSASKELPDNMDEAFILWLNKVSQKIYLHQRDAIESDKHTFGQPREENFEIPTIKNLSEDLYDGRSISLLLHYYCPNHVFSQDISIADPISIADAWHNLTQSLNFCNDVLLPSTLSDVIPPAILHPVDFLYCGQEMKVNIMVFLGTLYHYLEMDALEDVVSPLGHTVVCRRQIEIFSEDSASNIPEITSGQKTFSITSMDDRHQQTLVRANYIVPEVQPLISNATKRSFSKPSTADTDTVSTLTINESEGYGSPVPFSSKPLLVRRNRDIHAHDVPQPQPQPSSTAKLYTKTIDHLPVMKTQNGTDFDYTSDDGTSTSVSVPPTRKLNSYQGLINGDSNVAKHNHQPVVNKWHFRTPVQDLRNTNTSNNIGRHTSSSNDTSPQYMTASQTSQATNSALIYNVEMDSDNEYNEPKIKGRSRIHGHVYRPPSSSSKISWSTCQFDNAFETPRRMNQRTYNANDLVLETARTSDYHNTSRSPACNHNTTDSDNTSEFTSVSSRTTSNVTSSNEAKSQESVSNGTYFKQKIEKDCPVIVNTEISPEIQRNVTHIKPQLSSSIAPSSQQSYTVQNGNFHTMDSARAAGYTVIETSPGLHHDHNGTENITQLRSSGFVKKKQSPYTENDSGDKSSNVRNSAAHDHIIVDGTIVKLRNPQRRSVNRSIRSTKATSWMDQSKKRQNMGQPTEDMRRHSNVPSPHKIAVTLKKLVERRKFIETERRRIEDRKQFIEEEKRRKEKEWSNEFSQLQQEMEELDLQKSSHHKPSNKNEETSSDYSSKSPSPSSILNNIEHSTETENKVLQQFLDQHPTESPNSRSHNFFASPLSTTAYLAQKPEHSRVFDQSYKGDTQPFTKTSRIIDQKQTFNVSHDEGKTQFESQTENTYNVSQRHPQDTYNMSHEHPHPTNKERTTQLTNNPHRNPTVTRQNNTYDVKNENTENHKLFYQQQIEPPFMPITNQTNLRLSGDHLDVHPGTIGQLTYDVSGQCQSAESAHIDSVNSQEHNELHQRQLASDKNPIPRYEIITKPPEIKILQPLPSEQSTRRSLFPGGRGNQDPDTSTEQENIDPNHLGVGYADQTTYDSFSCKITVGSNHSTPHKMSPVHEMQGMVTPVKGNMEDNDMSSELLKTADRDRKGVRGFELIDEATPNTDVAKKKEQFLLKQLKKEDDLKRQRAERENQFDKRREVARVKQEEMEAKKAEEKYKRQQRLDAYKKKKLQQEEAQIFHQSSAIISGGSGKKHPAVKTEPSEHSTRSNKASGSGRSSPATEYNSDVHHNVNPTQGTTFIASLGVEQAHAKPFRTRKMSGGRIMDWDNESASSAVSSDYKGPKLYKQPNSKSNKHIVNNAISYCCLAGKVNETVRDNTIQILEMSEARHFMILFRDAKCQYRALYTYNPESENLRRLSGNGPKDVIPSMIERLFKYNSGRKSFSPLPSKTLSVSIDAITIKNSFWQSNKKVTVPKK